MSPKGITLRPVFDELATACLDVFLSVADVPEYAEVTETICSKQPVALGSPILNAVHFHGPRAVTTASPFAFATVKAAEIEQLVFGAVVARVAVHHKLASTTVIRERAILARPLFNFFAGCVDR